MAEVKWIKITVDIFKSRKFLVFETRKDKDSVEILWIKLLTLAAEVNSGGKIYIAKGVPLTNEALSAMVSRPVKNVETALDLFEQYGMIQRDDYSITISNWNKYQSAEKLDSLREYNRNAQRKSREKKKQVNDMSMTVNDNVNHREGEIREEEKRKENDENRKRERIEDSVSPLSLPDTQSDFLFDDEDGGGSVEEFDTKIKPLHGTLGRGVVMLSEKQIDLLLQELSIEEFDKYVDVVASQIEKGKTYGKTHYQAILDMAYQDRGM